MQLCARHQQHLRILQEPLPWHKLCHKAHKETHLASCSPSLRCMPCSSKFSPMQYMQRKTTAGCECQLCPALMNFAVGQQIQPYSRFKLSCQLVKPGRCSARSDPNIPSHSASLHLNLLTLSGLQDPTHVC
jgi:hypothetical protein